MNKKLLTLLGAAALILTACGGNTETNATPNGDYQDLVETGAPDASGALGGDIDLGNGIKIKLSQPEYFLPSQYASNYVKGNVANLFEATITNAGSKPIDWATVAFVATSTGGSACPDVLDGDNGVNGQPSGTLNAGSTETFKFGIACSTKAGAELNINITVAEKTAEVKGKLA